MGREAFHQLLLNELRELYSSEGLLLQALPQMAEAACAEELKKAFENHHSETQNQYQRLDKIFSILGEQSAGPKSNVMQALIAEVSKVIVSDYPDEVKDAALISAAQCIEHYEIARYGTAKTFAKELDHTSIMEILKVSLDEEGGTNQNLSNLAEGGIFVSGINRKAKG